jgi:hypothetical protein
VHRTPLMTPAAALGAAAAEELIARGALELIGPAFAEAN